MKVLTYGEDPLTLWALTPPQLSIVLEELKDLSSEEEILLFYRPSFGRGGSSSVFGEFDAILATPAGIYLIEGKWPDSHELRRGRIELDEAQVRRHRIFRWYLKAWREQGPSSWDAFREENLEAFKRKFEGRTIPRAETKLARNLEFVLGQLMSYGAEVRDVLLFVGPKCDDKPSEVIPEHFELICVEYEPANAGNYLDLTEAYSSG